MYYKDFLLYILGVVVELGGDLVGSIYIFGGLFVDVVLDYVFVGELIELGVIFLGIEYYM